MKGILEFDLNDPFESELHQQMIHAPLYVECLREFDNKLRELIKYHDRETIDLCEARELLSQMLQRRGLDIW